MIDLLNNTGNQTSLHGKKLPQIADKKFMKVKQTVNSQNFPSFD